MEQNFERLAQITMFNRAIGSSDGFVSIQNNNAIRTSRNPSGAGDAEVMSINSILSNNKDLVPFIIKIDIEGFEDDLFSKNTEWVERLPLLLIETHDWMLPNRSYHQRSNMGDRIFCGAILQITCSLKLYTPRFSVSVYRCFR